MRPREEAGRWPVPKKSYSVLSEVQGAVCEQSCDKGNSFPFSLIGRNSNFGSIAHWLMGKSLNPSVLSCEGRILIFLARIMAGSYMLPVVTCQINAWYMKVCGGHLHGLCIYWWKNSSQV